METIPIPQKPTPDVRAVLIIIRLILILLARLVPTAM